MGDDDKTQQSGPTRKIPKLVPGELTLELSQPEEVAEFLECVANLIRQQRKITILIH